MNVYLFELDSTRNTKEEIEIGLKALYEEIVCNGNQVVLSMNQIADSYLFLSLMMDESIYHSIYELFSCGSMKVSPHGNIHTASHYIQNYLSDDHYVFGGFIEDIIVDQENHTLKEVARDALRNADLSYIQTIIAKEKRPEIKQKMVWLKRYVEMILHISLRESAKNEVDQDGNQSTFELIQFFYQYTKTNYSLQWIEYLLKKPVALESLKNKRSWWRKELITLFQNDPTQEMQPFVDAMALVDLAYNYSVEQSIDQVSYHYDIHDPSTMVEDFLYRFQTYRLTPRLSQIFTGEEAVDFQNISNPFHWDYAYALANVKETKKPETFYYEKEIKEKRRNWEKAIWKEFFRSLGMNLLYAIVYVFIQILINFLQGRSELVRFDYLVLNIGYAFLVILVLGLFGSLLSEKLKIPDILDNARDMRKIFALLIQYYKTKRLKVAYVREKNNEKRVATL